MEDAILIPLPLVHCHVPRAKDIKEGRSTYQTQERSSLLEEVWTLLCSDGRVKWRELLYLNCHTYGQVVNTAEESLALHVLLTSSSQQLPS